MNSQQINWVLIQLGHSSVTYDNTYQTLHDGVDHGLYSLSDKTYYRQIFRGWILELSYRSEILQASRQPCCRGVCYISERLERSKPESHGFEAARDLAVGRPSAYGMETQGPRNTSSKCISWHKYIVVLPHEFMCWHSTELISAHAMKQPTAKLSALWKWVGINSLYPWFSVGSRYLESVNNRDTAAWH